MFKLKVLTMAAGLLTTLRTTAVQLATQLFERSRFDAPDRERQALARRDSAMNVMQLTASNVESRLGQLVESAHDADQNKRNFQLDNNIFRDLKQPDKLVTSFLIMLGWLIESVFTTTDLYADGYLDLIPAMGFAVTFSTVNVGLGLAAGFCMRYLGYRRQSPEQRPEYRWTRRLAVLGFLSLLGVDALMIFVGGRVRVTGNHVAIFDFSQMGFPATFGDGLALVIMVAAGLSFAVSVFKGYSGFSDPIPGYGDHAGRTHTGIDEMAEDIAHDAQGWVDDIAEGAEDDILDLLENPDDDMAFVEGVLTFNAEVQNAKDDVRVFAQSEWERHSFVQGKEIPRSALNISAFDALQIDTETLALTEAQTVMLDDLRRVHGETTARIGAAYTNYLAQAGQFRVPPPSP